jgi:hypothetical protein
MLLRSALRVEVDLRLLAHELLREITIELARRAARSPGQHDAAPSVRLGAFPLASYGRTIGGTPGAGRVSRRQRTNGS